MPEINQEEPSKPKRQSIIKYGRRWKIKDEALIELAMIRRGKDLFDHHRRFQSIVWPNLDHHRWSDIALQELINNKVTVLMGPGSSGKTHYAAKFFLTEYWAWANETTILASSTDLRGLQLRIWGEMSMLFNQAKKNHPWLAGNILESRHSISTDNLGSDSARDLRNGIIW